MAERRAVEAAPLPEHVTVPLLSLITQRSLDADYEHVAARRRTTGERPAPGPRQLVAGGLVLLVFGALVTMAAVRTNRSAASDNASRESLIQQVDLRRAAVGELQKRLSTAEKQVVTLQQQLNTTTTQEKAQLARVQRLAARTGFGAVTGPGIRVTLNSAPDSGDNELVRDSDLTLLSDALWAAGAEAISVNGQRLNALGAFRNVGIQVLLNTQPINPPYVFSVVGNPDTMPADLLSSAIGEKWYALKDSLGFRFDVQDGGTMTLPAARSQSLRSARIATTNEVEKQQKGDSAP
jgi:uncharacterized protein YlxW (UPF0749 family)